MARKKLPQEIFPYYAKGDFFYWRLLKLFSIIFVAAIAAIVSWLGFGSFDPCEALRNNMRQQFVQAKGTENTLMPVVIPDSMLDAYIVQKYGSISPFQCFTSLWDAQQDLKINN